MSDDPTPGPALDALIHVRVMGQRPIHGVAYPWLWADGHYHSAPPPYSTDIATAWQVVEHLRDLWTAATESVPGTAKYIPDPPFDDGCFFDILHRHADRRWPWAMLYLTPQIICEAALHAFGAHPDQQDEGEAPHE